MPRLQIPYSFQPLLVPTPTPPTSPQNGSGRPFLTFANPSGHKFHIHPIRLPPVAEDGGHGEGVRGSVVRVVHELPEGLVQLPKKVWWEDVEDGCEVEIDQGNKKAVVRTPSLEIQVDYSVSIQLEWKTTMKARDTTGEKVTFQKDNSPRAYTFDAQNGGVHHFVERETFLPLSEEDPVPSIPSSAQSVTLGRKEFVYGLGETTGGILKNGRRVVLEGRDALGYDYERGDPLYKITPFYTVFNRTHNLWHGVWYNTLSDSVFDMGVESDWFYGCYRSFKANSGPLDYYMILGSGTLPSVVSHYASLTSPLSSPTQSTTIPPPSASPILPTISPTLPTPSHQPATCLAQPAQPIPFSASPTLPPLSHFGYMASSLALAAEPHAQQACIEMIKTCRVEGFPVDALHLSSGYCQDEGTGDRLYFVWNRSRYPDPEEFGRVVEGELGVTLIVNIKPWLLKTHPHYSTAQKSGAFVKASPSLIAAPKSEDLTQTPSNPTAAQPTEFTGAGPYGESVNWLWSSAFPAWGLGSYIDFSTVSGHELWKREIREGLLGYSCTGMWIDNNEFSSLVDDDERFAGEIGLYGLEGGDDEGEVLERRMGWGKGVTRVGSVGRGVQTMGMAKSTYEALLKARPLHRPLVVSRSGVPGIQAYAHGSWGGDNVTTWKALKYSTKMTLSVGLSFGPGIYGHDIGGFAGAHAPSAELLLRWCQQGAWHTRFTVHSWKEFTVTLWMYKDTEPLITELLRDVVAFRYRLVPSLYSLYVDHYHRRGWPVLKPLMWYHSDDPMTLIMDEEFIFGTHILVAPVMDKGLTKRNVYLPAVINGSVGTVDPQGLWWCEFDTGVWRFVDGVGRIVELDAPLSRTATLVRSGGILVLGGHCARNVYDGTSSRTAYIFPAPSASKSNPSAGSFNLIEDDGISNAHIKSGAYTELEIHFSVGQDPEEVNHVEVGYRVVHEGYTLPYSVIWFVLPLCDQRKLKGAQGIKTVQGTGDLPEEREGRAVLGVLVH